LTCTVPFWRHKGKPRASNLGEDPPDASTPHPPRREVLHGQFGRGIFPHRNVSLGSARWNEGGAWSFQGDDPVPPHACPLSRARTPDGRFCVLGQLLPGRGGPSGFLPVVWTGVTGRTSVCGSVALPVVDGSLRLFAFQAPEVHAIAGFGSLVHRCFGTSVHLLCPPLSAWRREEQPRLAVYGMVWRGKVQDPVCTPVPVPFLCPGRRDARACLWM